MEANQDKSYEVVDKGSERARLHKTSKGLWAVEIQTEDGSWDMNGYFSSFELAVSYIFA